MQRMTLRPRSCAASDDGNVAAIPLAPAPFTCPAAGPQRDAATGLFFSRARAVRRRAGNRPPELEPIADMRVRRGSAHVPMLARDPDDDPLAYFVGLADGGPVPTRASIYEDGESAVFSWDASVPEGEYGFRAAVFDEGGDHAVRDFRLTVCNEIAPDGSCAPITYTPMITRTRIPTFTRTQTWTVPPTPSVTTASTGTAMPSPSETAVARSPTPTPAALASSTRSASATPTGAVATHTRAGSRTPTATPQAPPATPPPSVTVSAAPPTATAAPSVGSGGCALAPHGPSGWAIALLGLAAGIAGRRGQPPAPGRATRRGAPVSGGPLADRPRGYRPMVR
jgi:hypothetical protein